MKRLLLISFAFLAADNLNAQEVYTEGFTDTIISPQFFITVIAGVILALGFQFILTALSVAAGITAIGDVKKSYVENKNHTTGKHDFKDNGNQEEENTSSVSTGKMVTTGFGIWSTLTVAISLFGATAFAMNLSLVASPLCRWLDQCSYFRVEIFSKCCKRYVCTFRSGKSRTCSRSYY